MELEPIRTKPDEFKPGTRNLDTLSVDELKEYIADMKVEIARVEAEIDKKQGSRAAAESVFKS